MKILKMLILLSLLIVSAGIAIVCELMKIDVGPMLGSLIAGITFPYLIPSMVDLTDNEDWKSSQRKLIRARMLHKDTMIRISFAYLFRIKIDGKYFLVQNHRTKKYQPVGGAYKYYQEEAAYLHDKFSLENDNRVPLDKITKNDYRLLVKNHSLRKFVRRFNKTTYRETVHNLSREFIEEVFSTDILDKNDFSELTYKYCGRHMTKVEYSNFFDNYELLLADIIEVQLSDTQEEQFKNLLGDENIRYRFATAEEIRSQGVKFGTDKLSDCIANHTVKILSENNDKLNRRNKYKKMIKIQL